MPRLVPILRDLFLFLPLWGLGSSTVLVPPRVIDPFSRSSSASDDANSSSSSGVFNASRTDWLCSLISLSLSSRWALSSSRISLTWSSSTLIWEWIPSAASLEETKALCSLSPSALRKSLSSSIGLTSSQIVSASLLASSMALCSESASALRSWMDPSMSPRSISMT